jgi:two-component system sensor histidine kinase GlrK
MNTPTPPKPKPLVELRYPRSFLGLLLVGFAIVALPLIAGLVSNAFSIERLSEQSQKAVFNATLATQSARQLSTVALAMERSARYYAASGDRDLIELYKQSRESFRKLLGEFVALPFAPEMVAAADDVQKREAAIFALLGEKPPSLELSRQLERDFAVLSARTQSLNVLANQLIEQ